jgi:hypothetical protein
MRKFTAHVQANTRALLNAAMPLLQAFKGLSIDGDDFSLDAVIQTFCPAYKGSVEFLGVRRAKTLYMVS